jgi:tetratricopeptide (TPR) repeat protein
VEKKIPETKLALAKSNKISATLAYVAKDYNKALTLYQASYDAAADPVLFYNMGLCYMQLKNSKDGIVTLESYLKEAPTTDPNRADAEIQLIAMQEMFAEASFDAGQYEEALATYRTLYAKDAQPKRLAEIGGVYQKMGKADDANTAFRNFLRKANPDDPLRPEIEAQLPKTTATPKDKPNDRDKEKPELTMSDDGKGRGFPKFMLATAGVTGALGIAAGVLVFTSTKKLNELSSVGSADELNEEEIASTQLRRQTFAPACDVLLGVAVITGVVGIIGLRGSKKSEPKTTLLVSPKGATLTVRY